MVLLQHGGLDNLTGKTGLAMLRHRKGPIVAVIDPVHAGQQLEQVTGIARSVPIVENLQQALLFAPQAAVVGLAPSGGRLPDPLRVDAIVALRAGLHLASSLHTRLEEDPELAASRRPKRWTGICVKSHLSCGWGRAVRRRFPVSGCWRWEPIWPLER